MKSSKTRVDTMKTEPRTRARPGLKRIAAFLLLAALSLSAGVFAASPPQENASELSVGNMSSRINWDTIKWLERRYKIEALRFKARDETGIDWWGSDEVMIETRDAKGWTVSNEIGGIDSGDTHHFEPARSCVVGVRPGSAVLGESSICSETGEAAPLIFNVTFWEKDFFPGAGFCIPGWGGADQHWGPHCANDRNGDDFIGSAQVSYTTQELEAALPNVGDQQIESIKLDACPGEICAGYPDYTFTWRITRLPNAMVDLSLLLKEVRQNSGGRSDLESISEGLRLLIHRDRALSREK